MGDEGRDGSGGHRAAALAALIGVAACGRAPAPAAPSAARAGGDTGFLAPPTLLQATWAADGHVRLAGRAPPDSTVRLQSPDGRSLGVVADAAGAWAAELPAAAAPSLFALSAELGGRTLRGEGALAIAPPGAGAAAVLLRAGAPADVAVAGPPPSAPSLDAVDFDAGGGVAAAGRAPAGARLKLMVDGAAVGAGAADGAGRFGLPGVGAPLALGPHRMRVEAATGAAEAAVDTAAAPPLGSAPFRTARTAGGWRIDWSPSGGGVQSLVWLDAARAAR